MCSLYKQYYIVYLGREVYACKTNWSFKPKQIPHAKGTRDQRQFHTFGRPARGKVILSFPPISKRDFAETKKKKKATSIDNSPEGNYEIGIMCEGQSKWTTDGLG